MRQGGIQLVGAEVCRDHDQVLGNPLRILLAEGSQLVVHLARYLLARDFVRDSRFGESWTRRHQAGAATALGIRDPALIARTITAGTTSAITITPTAITTASPLASTTIATS